jgi:UTP--glucose-1-phosphate uridylyltransferase
VDQVLVPAAGRGTRLLPATKEQPKEMLPIFSTKGGALRLVPILELVFDQLFAFGFRKFCFIVGREKRAIEDYFTFDSDFANAFSRIDRQRVDPMLQFYERTKRSTIAWVNQADPLGFGHAVLAAESMMSGKPFLVHAGDTLIYSNGYSHLKRLVEVHESSGAEATLLLKEIPSPKHYGVAEVHVRKGVLLVDKIIEKPVKPRSNFAVMPLYIFEPSIFAALKATKPGLGGEIQLTDGIQRMIDQGKKIVAVKLTESESRLDIGNPEYYWEALRVSHEKSVSKLEKKFG